MYPQNPVFAVSTNGLVNDENGMRDAPSPSLSSGKNVFRNKTIEVKPRREYASDSDHTRPTSPASQSVGVASKGKSRVIESVTADETPARASSKGPGRGNWRRNRLEPSGDPSIAPRSTPKAAPKAEPLTTVFVPVNGVEPSANKRARPPTSHQLALENFRKQRVNHIIDRGLKKVRAKATRKRKAENPVVRAWKRIRTLDATYDSEEEANTTGAGRAGAARTGIAFGGFGRKPGKADDYGEEAAEIGYMFGRFRRRIDPVASNKWHDEWLVRHPPKKESSPQFQQWETSDEDDEPEQGLPRASRKSGHRPSQREREREREREVEEDVDEMDVDDRERMRIPQFNPTPVAYREEEHWSDDEEDDG